jgi:hypothetical protein
VFGGTYLAINKRVQVVFTDQQWKLISNLRGEFGNGDADIVRNIVLSWLSEKSIISTNLKRKMDNNNEKIRKR